MRLLNGRSAFLLLNVFRFAKHLRRNCGISKLANCLQPRGQEAASKPHELVLVKF